MSFALFMLGVVWVDSILVNLTFNVLLSMKLVFILFKKNNNWELQPQITKTILKKKRKVLEVSYFLVAKLFTKTK